MFMRFASLVLGAAALAAAATIASPAAAQTQLPPPTAYAPADARQDRIEELEQQLVQSTGENERLQFELMQANREIARLRAMVGELAGVNQSVVDGQDQPAGEPQVLSPGSGPGSGGGQASLNPAQQRAVGTLGSVPAQPPGPAHRSTDVVQTALPAPPMPVREPADDYSVARDLLNNGNLAQAEVAFEEFLGRYADSAEPAMLADVRYWLAFTLLARNNYPDAAANFVNYLQNNSRGPQAPEAQVRLGMALAGMGEVRQACGAFNQLAVRYPNAPARVRNLAVREARAANCPA